MKNSLYAFVAALVLMGVFEPLKAQTPQSPGIQQVPAWVPSSGFGSIQSMYQLPPGGMDYPPGMQAGAIQQASYCDGCGLAPMNCGCNDGFTYTSPCAGACGGACGGGCGAGGRGGPLKRLLGRGGAGGGMLGGGGLGGGGLGSGLLGGGLGAGLGGLGYGGWIDAEYLLWWNKDRFIPALATQSPAGTALASAGVLGDPSTTILFGNEKINSSPNSGFRISGGTWLDSGQTYGIGGRYFFAGGEETFSAQSDGDPILARPITDTVSGASTALLVAYPGVNSGSIDIVASNEVRGFDVYIRKLLLSGHCNRFDLIGGYHNSTIEDRVEINNSITGIDGTRIPVDATVATRDLFEVTNQFNGGFIGLMAESGDGRLSWSTMAKVAFGNMNQEARIGGSTTTSIPGAGSATSPFGLLALPTNIGTIDQDEFAFVPELNVTVRYNLNSRAQLLLGYTLIYWSEVALAGDVIDLNVNTSQLAGPLAGAAAPTATLKSDDFWYTGLSVGGSIRF